MNEELNKKIEAFRESAKKYSKKESVKGLVASGFGGFMIGHSMGNMIIATASKDIPKAVIGTIELFIGTFSLIYSGKRLAFSSIAKGFANYDLSWLLEDTEEGLETT